MNELGDDVLIPDPSWGNYKLFKIYEEVEMESKMRERLTAEQRLQFKLEREALVGNLITQKGPLCGALVKAHVRGSQYVVCLPNGTEVHASHKKARRGHSKPSTSLSEQGWRLWEERV
jgi:hypothetical protein